MKRLLLFAVLAATLAAGRAATIGDLFVAENYGIFNTLTPTMRVVMLNHYRDGDTTRVANNMAQNGSRIVSLDDRDITVETSVAARVQLRLLTQGRDSLVMAVETVLTPYPDSRVSFYGTNWEARLASGHFKMPAMADFLLPNAPKDIKRRLPASLDFTMIEVEVKGDTLVARHHLDKTMDTKEYATFAPYLRRELRYTIKGTKISPAR